MSHEQIAVMIPIFLGLGIFTMIIFLRRYQYLERMQMFERGINPKDVQSIIDKQRDPYRHLRWACTAIGVGLGLFIGNLSFNWVRHNEGIIFGLVFMLGGLGLLIGYIIQLRLQGKNSNDNSDI
jgi:uncharacterized membrane protein YgdD (TMEM256/DUF423 family)